MGHEEDGKDYMGEAVAKLQDDVGELKEWKVGMSAEFKYFKQAHSETVGALKDMMAIMVKSSEESKELIQQNKQTIEIMKNNSEKDRIICRKEVSAEIKTLETKSDIADIKQQNEISNLSKSEKIKAWWSDPINKIVTMGVSILGISIINWLGFDMDTLIELFKVIK